MSFYLDMWLLRSLQITQEQLETKLEFGETEVMVAGGYLGILQIIDFSETIE